MAATCVDYYIASGQATLIPVHWQIHLNFILFRASLPPSMPWNDIMFVAHMPYKECSEYGSWYAIRYAGSKSNCDQNHGAI